MLRAGDRRNGSTQWPAKQALDVQVGEQRTQRRSEQLRRTDGKVAGGRMHERDYIRTRQTRPVELAVTRPPHDEGADGIDVSSSGGVGDTPDVQ